jgi:hypothetical protein
MDRSISHFEIEGEAESEASMPAAGVILHLEPLTRRFRAENRRFNSVEFSLYLPYNSRNLSPQ